MLPNLKTVDTVLELSKSISVLVLSLLRPLLDSLMAYPTTGSSTVGTPESGRVGADP